MLYLAFFAFTMAAFWSVVSSVVTVCSFLHTVMPPWEAFNDFPSVQKYYKLLLFTVGYIALNGRSTVYPSLSTQSGTKLSDVPKTETSKGSTP